MPAKNFPLGIPRLNNPGTHYSLSRTNVANENVKIFWGPGQTGSFEAFDYTPPTDWPRPGLMLRLPNTCRMFWESTDLDAEALAVGGYSGSYTYGIHIDHAESHDHYTGSGVFPADFSVDFVFGGLPPKVTYATPFHIVQFGIEGPDVFEHFYIDNGLFINSFEPKFFVPPFSKVDYTNEGSITIQAITIGYDLMAAGFSPATVDPGNEFTVPRFIVSTPDGPNSIGLFVHDTGRYYVDGEILANGSIFTIPSNPFAIPEGWRQPIPIDKTHRDPLLQEAMNFLADTLKKSTYPYFDIFHSYQPSSGITDFVYPALLPTGVEEPLNYMTSNTLIFLYIAKPHNIPNGFLTALLQSQYTKFNRFRCVVYVDKQWMLDNQLDVGLVESFMVNVTDWIASMSAYGWVFGGYSIEGPDGFCDGISGNWSSAGKDTPNGNLLDNIASQISVWFPIDTDGITPATFDPPRPSFSPDTSDLGNPGPKVFPV